MAADRPFAAWGSDKQPVRCLDRCPGGTVAHASLQMSGFSHGLRNEVIVSSERAQKGISSCPRATFFMLSPGCQTVLWAKLAHIVLKGGQCFNARPACPRQFLAPFLHSHDGFFWPTRRQFVQDRVDDVEGVASVSEQGYDAQAAHLVFVVEAVAAVLLANRVQQALLFPEMQGGDTHAYLLGRFSHPDPLGMMGALQRIGLYSQCT